MANNQLLASDNFTSGSLAAGWTAFPGVNVCAITASPTYYVEPAAINTQCGQLWTGLTWGSEQIGEVILQTFNATGTNQIQIWLRKTGGAGAENGYIAIINHSSAPLADCHIYRIDAGAATSLVSVASLTFASGDIWTFQASGACLSVYQNYKRVIYFYDPAYTSGTMGFRMLASTAVTNCQIASWRGYNCVQQDGIWQKQGVVIPAIAADLGSGVGIQNFSILHEGNAQILSGTVYKTWPFQPQGGNVYYAESTDGISWTRAVTAALSGYTNISVFKNGSTYYMYCQTNAGDSTGTIQVLTGVLGGGSPGSDGITWTLQSPTNTISLGSAGQWDAGNLYPIAVGGNIAGTWYGFYGGTKSFNTNPFSTGLVTSSDLLNWTKYVGNPVIVEGGPTIPVLVGTTWYMWTQANLVGQGNPNGAKFLDPIEGLRYKSIDLINWTTPVNSVHHSQIFESLNTNLGNCAPGVVIDVGGKAFMYINAGPNDGGSPAVQQIELAIAPVSIAQVVTALEDAVQQVATDSFTSGTGNLSANWTTPAGSTKLKIIAGNLCEPTASATVCTMAYTGTVFSSNQYSEVTIAALTGGGSFANSISPTVRTQTAANSFYGAYNNGTAGAQTTIGISKEVSGVNSAVSPSVAFTPQVGDVMRLAVTTGSDGFPVLSLFQNGFMLVQATDYTNSLTSGSPGMSLLATTTLANVQTSLWAGGNASVIPHYIGGGATVISGGVCVDDEEDDF